METDFCVIGDSSVRVAKSRLLMSFGRYETMLDAAASGCCCYCRLVMEKLSQADRLRGTYGD
jgi:hypothetical protein